MTIQSYLPPLEVIDDAAEGSAGPDQGIHVLPALLSLLVVVNVDLLLQDLILVVLGQVGRGQSLLALAATLTHFL